MIGMRAIANGLTLGGPLFALCAPALIFAQDAGQESKREVSIEESAFVNQAPEDASSKVYFPDVITPQSVAAARARAARQQQIESADAKRAAPVAQVSSQGGSNQVPQLSDGNSDASLSQLSAAERRVLLDAVEGSDICERGSDIPALKALCEARLETRSEEFAQNRGGSAEDNLLGGGLDAGRVATLEAAIARLAGVEANPGNFDNQVVASVALNNQSLNGAQAAEAEADPTSELSQETQALVGAIVEQLGGGN
ncbi:hypothetical protein [Erythrobacter sp.]|uniref:hypothetical protein n=1 Tax=Sphingomonadales TaxID=204457 RepID=UPI0032671607